MTHCRAIGAAWRGRLLVLRRTPSGDQHRSPGGAVMARVASSDIVVLGQRRRARLEAIVACPSSAQVLVRRARIVLLAHQGRPNTHIAAELGAGVGTVRTWRRRFIRGGIRPLADRPRRGRPQVYGPGARLAIVATATSTPPEALSRWTHQLIADEPVSYTHLRAHETVLDLV